MITIHCKTSCLTSGPTLLQLRKHFAWLEILHRCVSQLVCTWEKRQDIWQGTEGDQWLSYSMVSLVNGGSKGWVLGMRLPHGCISQAYGHA